MLEEFLDDIIESGRPRRFDFEDSAPVALGVQGNNLRSTINKRKEETLRGSVGFGRADMGRKVPIGIVRRFMELVQGNPVASGATGVGVAGAAGAGGAAYSQRQEMQGMGDVTNFMEAPGTKFRRLLMDRMVEEMDGRTDMGPLATVQGPVAEAHRAARRIFERLVNRGQAPDEARRNASVWVKQNLGEDVEWPEAPDFKFDWTPPNPQDYTEYVAPQASRSQRFSDWVAGNPFVSTGIITGGALGAGAAGSFGGGYAAGKLSDDPEPSAEKIAQVQYWGGEPGKWGYNAGRRGRFDQAALPPAQRLAAGIQGRRVDMAAYDKSTYDAVDMWPYYGYKDFYREQAHEAGFNPTASVQAGTFREDYPVKPEDIPSIVESIYSDYASSMERIGQEIHPGAMDAIAHQVTLWVETGMTP